jgi:uncharacterized protein (TIGR02271 family)
MARTMEPQDLIDTTVVDPSGSKIGKVGTVYLADTTRQPEWITVKTGLFGTKESFVPLSGAAMDEDGVHVKVAKDMVSDAPKIDADGHLTPDESAQLYRHYGLPMPRSAPDQMAGGNAGRDTPAGRGDAAGRNRATGRGDVAGRDQAPAGRGQATDRTDDGMIRSEERLKVGTEQVESGHVHLRKYVVTEQQQVTVPVSHEEVRVVREPIAEGTRAGGKIGEQDQEITLHAEKAVVSKETVPVEKVRLNTETVTEEQTVSGEIRKEQFEVTDDTKKHRKA